MNKFIVLLRGINVSGKNKILMSDLRDLLKDLGFKNVKTYIQSGNIILNSEKTKSEVCKIIQEGIFKKFDLHIHAIARTLAELKTTINNYPFSSTNDKIVAFTFLNKCITLKTINISNIGQDKYQINKDIVYLYCPSGFGKTKLTNNIIEKKIDVIATTRNLKTTLKLTELAE